MKKLIIAAAIVCAATISQAASVGWAVGATNWKGCDYSLFVIGKNGVTGTDQIKTIVEAGGLEAASAYAFAGGTVASTGAINVQPAASGKSITWTGPSAEEYTAFVFVESAAGDEAAFSSTAVLKLENDSTSKSWAFGNQNTNFANNTFEVGGTPETPEPTSGLLLLLGVAGLALRRRRA